MKAKIIFLLFILSACLYAQDKNSCAIKIGGGTFINMKHIIVYHGTDVCDIKSRNDSIVVTMQFYESSGKLLATVVNSGLKEKNNNDLELKYSDSEFTLISKSTKQIFCLIKKNFDPHAKRCELQVWMDTYLPQGFYLRCTPEENYSPQMQNIIFKGATMSNGFSAITID